MKLILNKKIATLITMSSMHYFFCT